VTLRDEVTLEPRELRKTTEYDMIKSYRHRDIVEFENYGSHVYDMAVITTIVRQIN
jgi:hypothetical protein